MSGDSWSEMFKGRGEQPPGPSAAMPRDDSDDTDLSRDPTAYRPWTLRRGRSSPLLMLELRRYEPRSGLWSGWQMSYPTLNAVEYTGDRFLTLDFGNRQFVIEGTGLDELARHLQQGTVATIQEFAPAIWRQPAVGPSISNIRKIASQQQFDA